MSYAILGVYWACLHNPSGVRWQYSTLENALVLNLTLKILSSAIDLHLQNKEVFRRCLPYMIKQGRNSIETTEATGRKMQKRLCLL